MDNAFTQIIITEIETLNLRASQYTLLIAKGEAETFKEKKVPEDILILTQNLIDEIKISIIQIIRKIKPIANKLKVSPTKIDEIKTKADEIIKQKSIPVQKLEELLDDINEIYANRIIETKLETTTQTTREFIKGGNQ